MEHDVMKQRESIKEWTKGNKEEKKKYRKKQINKGKRNERKTRNFERTVDDGRLKQG